MLLPGHWIFRTVWVLPRLTCRMMLKQLGITTRKRNPSILMLVAIFAPTDHIA